MVKRLVPMLVLMMGPAAFAADVYRVPPGPTLPAVVAGLADGDSVQLEVGTYTACLRPTTSLTIRGAGVGQTIIECGTVNTTLIIDAGYTVRLAELTLKNPSGSAISIDGATLIASSISIEDVLDTVAGHAGGITATDARIVLGDVTIVNARGPAAGGIYALRSDVSLYGGVISGSNSTNAGGALTLDDQSTAWITRTAFTSNFAGTNGGAIALRGIDAQVSLYAVTMSTNSAQVSGGAIYVADGRSLSDTLGVYDGNNAQDDGGAIWSNGALTVTGTTFTNSQTDDGDGGAIYASGSLTSRSRYANNTSPTGNGGAIAVVGGTFGSGGDDYESNSANTHGGAVYLSGSDAQIVDASYNDSTATGSGGAVYAAGVPSYYLEQYSEYVDNGSTLNGGGLAIAGPSTGFHQLDGVEFSLNSVINGHGGALSSDGVYVTLYGAVFDENQATNSTRNGGGWFLADTGGWVEASLFTNNRANTGAAISHLNSAVSSYELDVIATRFTTNGDDLGTTVQAGAIYEYFGSLDIERSWFDANVADTSGAILAEAASSVTIEGSLLCRNESANGEGGGLKVVDANGPSSYNNNVFVENQAYRHGGAVYENSRASSDMSTWYGNTFLGNYSALSPNWASHVGANGAYAIMVDNIFYNNGSYAFASVNLPGTHEYYGNLIDSNGLSGMAFTDNDYTAAVYLNDASGSAGVGLAAWNTNRGCYGNTYVSNDTTHPGLENGGVGIEATGRYANMGVDNDGDGLTVLEGDCDDNDATRYRGASEVANNGVDENCTGWYGYDEDGDGYSARQYLFGAHDCDDSDPTVNPGAAEDSNDAVDENCDDHPVDDNDGDGFAGLEDCADDDVLRNPDAVEIWYDGVNQDCNSLNDDDADLDGYDVTNDCDDFEDDAWPGNASDRWYDGIDGNCDGHSDFDQDDDGDDSDEHGGGDCDDLDPNVSSLSPEVWYNGTDENCSGDGDSDYDQDGDGYDSEQHGGDDCGDTDEFRYPGAPERINGLDDNCDGVAEEAYDADLDGIADQLETDNGTDPESADSDGDGLPDAEEWGNALDEDALDSDGDGTVDAADADDDDDGVPTVDETLADTDGDTYRETMNSDAGEDAGDTLPDHLDPDDDADGIPTLDEGGEDLDGDGTFNYLDLDSDGDLAADGSEGADDLDDDGIPDFLDNGADSAAVVDAPFPNGPDKYGCGCDTSPSGSAGLVLAGLLALLPLRRRR